MGGDKAAKKAEKKKAAGDEGAQKKKSVSRAQKAGIVFPCARIGKSLKKDGRSKRVATTSSICIAVALEYTCAEILELAVEKCKKDNRKRVSPQDIVRAVRADPELHRLTSGMVLSAGETMRKISKQVAPAAVERNAEEEE
tara:strand:+ start:15417 stop:15839 length:423 start_codon:yes stop_codon:yes gene_type:complete